MRFGAFILQKYPLKNVRSLFEESPDRVIHSFLCKIRLFNQKTVFSPKHIINFLAFNLPWNEEQKYTIIKVKNNILVFHTIFLIRIRL